MKNMYYRYLHFGAVLSFLSLWTVVEPAVHDSVNELINNFLAQRRWSAVVIFSCWNKVDLTKLLKQLTHAGLYGVIRLPGDATLESLRVTDFRKLAVILDLNCEGSQRLLAEASEKNLFSSQHFWLLLTADAVTWSHKDLDVPLDSHVTVAEPRSDLNGAELWDLYKSGSQQPLTVTPRRIWDPTHMRVLPPEPRRDDYGGIPINATLLFLDDDTDDAYLDLRYRHLNTEGKLHFVLMMYISEMLNFRLNFIKTFDWGYPVNGSHCFTGVVGSLQEECGLCEIAAVGIMWKTERMDAVDYVTETVKFRGAFMFLKPSLSEVSIIYELPFSKSVWITYTLTVALLTVVLVFNRHVQKRTRPNKSQGRPLLWTDAVLDTIGIVCQQGAENVPESVSSRIVFVFLLLLSLFLITSYSAIIVSLLQMTSSSINTMADLMNSPMKLSMVDKFVNERTDPAVEKVFQEKLLTQPFQEAFVPEQVGLEKIRRGLYAFHGFFEAYKIISDTYEDHEKCRFKEINMFLSNHVGFPIRKGSPYSEHLRQRILWMREVGILGREEKRWYYQKPKCESGGQNFVSVGIQDFYPTLVILAYGILLSVGFLVVEAIHNRYKYKKKAQN